MAFHYDGLGSTVNLTNNDGTTQVSYKLDPWGTIKKQTGSSVNRQVFTGQEYDENTGLIYFGARHYDPDIARFMTQDSYLGEYGTPPSLHRYLYAYSNPTVYVDLYGYDSIKVDEENNKVYWNIEKDGFFYNPDVRDVYIGDLDDEGQVKLTQEFGGGIVAHEHLKKAASNFWYRRGTESIMNPYDISGEKAEYQDQLINSYIKDTFFTDHLSADWRQHRTWSEKHNMDTDGLITRGGGLVKTVVGVAGAYITSGSVVAAPAAVYFSDLAVSGSQEVATGESHPTYFTKGAYSIAKTAGASDEGASKFAFYSDAIVGAALFAGAPQSTFMPKSTPKVYNKGRAASNITTEFGDDFQSLLKKVQSADFSTSRDGAVFWTGYHEGNKAAAIAWAKANGKKTIEMTRGGEWLNSVTYGPNVTVSTKEAEHLWRAASAKFARSASGRVNAFTMGTYQDTNKVFYGLELKLLKKNPNVNPGIKYRGY